MEDRSIVTIVLRIRVAICLRCDPYHGVDINRFLRHGKKGRHHLTGSISSCVIYFRTLDNQRRCLRGITFQQCSHQLHVPCVVGVLNLFPTSKTCCHCFSRGSQKYRYDRRSIKLKKNVHSQFPKLQHVNRMSQVLGTTTGEKKSPFPQVVGLAVVVCTSLVFLIKAVQPGRCLAPISFFVRRKQPNRYRRGTYAFPQVLFNTLLECQTVAYFFILAP